MAILLGETDFNDENLGFANNKFIKVDHGQSIFLGYKGATFKQELNFTPTFLSRISELNTRYFSKENINEALKEIGNTIENHSHQISRIINNYELILSKYRINYGEPVYHLVGREENTIAAILESNFNQAQEMGLSNKTSFNRS